MSAKKTITVRTEPQDVEIEGNLITNDELRKLYLAVRGGNAERDNVELMRHLAVNVVKDSEIVRGLHYRAAMLEEALEQIKTMVWPREEVEKVLEINIAEKQPTSA